MKEIIKEAKTVESAIAAALQELHCQREEAEIEVLQEPVRGIFGLAKTAKVKVVRTSGQEDEAPRPAAAGQARVESSRPRAEASTQRAATEEEKQKAQQLIEKTLKLMGIDKFELKIRNEENSLIYQIETDCEGLLIGHHGRTLEAFQYLINRIMNEDQEERVRYVLDIGGYLSRHQETLEKIAARTVRKVKESKQEVALKAMNAVDRRIVHMYLKDDPEVRTYSDGEGANRHVIIAPKIKEE